MAGVEIVDRSGQSRGDDEIREAMRFLGERLVRGFLNDPGLTIQIPVLLDACKMALAFNLAVRRVKEGAERIDPPSVGGR